MNTTDSPVSISKFSVGELIHHKKFDYRGVIVDVDANFQLSDEWYENVARSKPPKDQPWYHVLVDGSVQMTYVAERHLENDTSGEPVTHPLVNKIFGEFKDGRYLTGKKAN